MDGGPQSLLYAVTTLLDLSVAVAAGACVATLWLVRGASGWTAARLPRVRRWAMVAIVAALAAHAALLVLDAAALAEVPLSEAGGPAFTLLTVTHYGLAWGIGAAGLALAAMLGVATRWRQARATAIGTLAALAAFWYSRSMVSHAANAGDASLPVLADWAHVGLASLWVGEVILAGLVTLTGQPPKDGVGRRARAAYVAALSASTTAALAGILATGLYAAWHNLGSLDALTGSPYGNALLVKLAFVAGAMLLGGVNRFFVMPRWLAHEGAGQDAPAALPGRFRRVLWIEAVVLVTALALAAVLASTSPPGAG